MPNTNQALSENGASVDEATAEDVAGLVPLNWLTLEPKLRPKMHHIRVSLNRSGKKGKTFCLRALLKKVRFYRSKLEAAEGATKDTPAEVMAEHKRQLKKYEHDLEGMKNVNIGRVVHEAFLTTLRGSELPDKERFVELWQSVKPDGEKESKDEMKPSKEENQPHSPLPATEWQRVHNRLASSETVINAVKEGVEAIKLILGGKKAQRAKAQAANKKAVKRKRDGSDDQQDSGESSESDDDNNLRIPKSMFMTSLGGDDEYSEFSVSDAGQSDYDEPIPKKVKKNRMGQRARREMAEKVYGRKAKHLAQRREHDPKRIDHAYQRTPRSAAPDARRQIARDVKPTGIPENAHPSWEAKRKAKEAQAAALTAAKPKKIVFAADDD
ncbi:hypothetical protein HDU85_001415 [Gaertneriomyces sp. JEL0708]|nr:hypothetical protein HDU85_001415 [Gaertneriomyces sp. JEL0708]